MATNFNADFARFLMDSQKAQAKVMGVGRKTQYPFKSSEPFRFDLEIAGLALLFDYCWDYDDNLPDVLINAVRLEGADGSETPLKSGAVSNEVWAQAEALIVDKINDDNDASAQSLRDGE